MKRKNRAKLLLDLRYDACGWRIGGYTAAPRYCLWMMSIALPQTAAKRTREQTSYEDMKPLGIRRRDTSIRALVETSRCQERGIGRGETGSMSKSRHDR